MQLIHFQSFVNALKQDRFKSKSRIPRQDDEMMKSAKLGYGEGAYEGRRGLSGQRKLLKSHPWPIAQLHYCAMCNAILKSEDGKDDDVNGDDHEDENDEYQSLTRDPGA